MTFDPSKLTQAQMSATQQAEHLCLRCCHNTVCSVYKLMDSARWFITISQCAHAIIEPEEDLSGAEVIK